jgi:intracellular multiplication protein IcmK
MRGCLSKEEWQVGFAGKQKGKRFMNKLKSIAIVVCLLPLMAGLIWAESCSASDAAGQQVRVLGQPDMPPENQAGDAKKESGSAQKKESPADNQKPDAQTLFQESLRQMMPLDEGQIQEYRERSDQREKALLPVSPALNSRTVRVSLEPGNSPVAVRTTANVATSLVFHDSTGQPWPITSVTNGGPSFFQVLRPDLPDGNLLNVMPVQGYGTSTIVVTLEKRDIPLVIRLESDSVRSPERKADALVLFQLAHHGPKAAIPVIQDIKETANSTMLAFLDHTPPSKAARVRLEPSLDKLTVWKLGENLYIRTQHALIWPAWTAVVNGAGNVKCYEAPVTSRIMLSVNGQVQSIVLKEGGAK